MIVFSKKTMSCHGYVGRITHGDTSIDHLYTDERTVRDSEM